MEKIKFTEILERHGAREAKRLNNLSIGGVATKELEPDETEDFFVDGGEGLAIDLDPDGMQKLADRAIQDPAS